MLIATDDELDCPDDKLLDAHNHRYGCNLMHRDHVQPRNKP